MGTNLATFFETAKFQGEKNKKEGLFLHFSLINTLFFHKAGIQIIIDYYLFKRQSPSI